MNEVEKNNESAEHNVLTWDILRHFRVKKKRECTKIGSAKETVVEKEPENKIRGNLNQAGASIKKERCKNAGVSMK